MIPRKLLLLGEIGVGKTSLVRRLVHDELPSDYRATMGVDLYRYDIGGIGACGRRSLEIVVWDLDGNYGLSIFRHVYLKGTSGALIIGDANRPSTLEHMASLAEGFRDTLPSRPYSLVVNKVDLVADTADVPLPPGLVAPHTPLIWTSALASINVLAAFRHAADAILRRES